MFDREGFLHAAAKALTFELVATVYSSPLQDHVDSKVQGIC